MVNLINAHVAVNPQKPSAIMLSCHSDLTETHRKQNLAHQETTLN